MTVDRLAEITQQQFTIVDAEFAKLRAEMRQGFAQVRQEITDLRGDMNAGFASVGDQIREEMKKFAYGPEIDDLRHRVNHIEKKIGIKHKPRLSSKS